MDHSQHSTVKEKDAWTIANAKYHYWLAIGLLKNIIV